MELQGQSVPSFDTEGRSVTIFPQRGGKTSGLSELPAKHEETVFLTSRYMPRPTRKKALCDFRVRWPELVYKEQEEQREDIQFPSLDRKPTDISSCSSGLSISFKNQESSRSEIQDSPEFPDGLSDAPHVTILKSYLKPESMTRLERKVRRRTLMAMNQLEHEKEAAKFRRAVLLRDTRELQDEKALEEAEDKPFLQYLERKNQETQEKYESLWKDYIQQSQEIKNRRQELVSTLTSRTANLQKQLIQNKKFKASLKKNLKVLEPMAQIKKSQDREIEALELEQVSIVADIPLMDREAHFQFLRERAALEKQVEDLNLLESGEDVTRELKRKAKAWVTAAKQAHKDFCQDINAQNTKLRTQLRKLDQEFCKLEAEKEKLERRKQQWKEQQWYLEALARGRKRLQQREHRLQQREHRQQQREHPELGRLLSARPKATPK